MDSHIKNLPINLKCVLVLAWFEQLAKRHSSLPETGIQELQVGMTLVWSLELSTLLVITQVSSGLKNRIFNEITYAKIVCLAIQKSCVNVDQIH